MNEEQLKILKTMHEATGRMDINMFAEAVNLSPNQAIEQVQKLAQDGFLRKVGTGYGVTDKGKAALKVFMKVDSDKVFNFYVGVNLPLGFSAGSLEEFYRLVKQVCSDSLDFHLHRGDFENWLRDVIGDAGLAEEVKGLKDTGLNGEKLRKALLKIFDDKYAINELL